MASRPLRLLLLAIVIEVFAVVFALTPISLASLALVAPSPYSQGPDVSPVVGRLVALAIGVIGLVVAFVGFSATEVDDETDARD